MITIIDLLTIIPASRNDIENWHRRLELRTDYQPFIPGRPRFYSRENAIELASVGNFIAGGMTPKIAAAYAAMIVRNAGAGTLRRWFIGGANGKGIATNDVDAETLAKACKEFDVSALIVVNMGEIVAKVDRLFASVEM